MEIAEKQVVSVNVGLPRQVLVGNAPVMTAIFKSPVQGKVAIRGNNLQGDQQADLTVHGGQYKAVYLYPREHYAYWASELPGKELPLGVFGENLTTTGLTEETVRIGDRYRIGSAVLEVTQPRSPCYKLALRFELADMVNRFWRSGRAGIYFSVVEEGEIAAGDSIERISQGPEDITVAGVVRLFKGEDSDPEALRRALRAPLRGGWKEGLEERRRDIVAGLRHTDEP